MNYSTASDEAVHAARQALKDEHGETFFQFIDHFGLYACPQTLMRSCYIYELVTRAIKVPGDIYEFGTWLGSNALFMAKILNELEPFSSRRIIIFDNFSGLPEPSSKDGEYASSVVGKYQGNRQRLERLIKIFGLGHRVLIVDGDANNTIPTFFASEVPHLVSLAYFDFDLYEPTRLAINALKTRAQPGSIFAFDEGLDVCNWHGECLAARELTSDPTFKFTVETRPTTRQPQLVLTFS